MKYFIRIDYVFKCLPVQRVRMLVNSLSRCRHIIGQYVGDDYLVLAVKIERCS